MMKHIRNLGLVFALLAMSGCATIPIGPSVRVMPGPQKTFERFQLDDAICRQWAGQQIGQSPQETLNQSTISGAAVGTVLGTAAGAVIGSASGNAGTGAAIGAGTGLLVGTASGANYGQYYEFELQRRYDISYEQCMYAKGNQIPGMVTTIRRVRRSPPPPPPAYYNSVPPDYVPSYQPPLK